MGQKQRQDKPLFLAEVGTYNLKRERKCKTIVIMWCFYYCLGEIKASLLEHDHYWVGAGKMGQAKWAWYGPSTSCWATRTGWTGLCFYPVGQNWPAISSRLIMFALGGSFYHLHMRVVTEIQALASLPFCRC